MTRSSLTPVFLLAVALASSARVPARDATDAGDPPPGPYCGISCVYAALATLGLAPEFDSLVQPRYVGSRRGSSLDELVRAVNDFGGTARPMTGLTIASLRASRQPAILHVRRPGRDGAFSHWILFLGFDGDSVRLLDPPGRPESVAPANLLAMWDGIGLFVGSGPVPDWPVRAAGWLEFGVALAAVVAALGLARLGLGRNRRLGLLGLSGVAAVVAVASHSVDDAGLLRNRAAVADVIGRHFTTEVPTIGQDEVRAALGSAGTEIIDVRLAKDYAAGHLPGAVHLPITAGFLERERAMKAIRPDDRVIVYCLNERCQWAWAIASDLAHRGHANVFVYAGGWEEWERHERANQGR